jgi:hypothetical protein
MQRHITEKQFKSNVAKFGFKSFDAEVLDSINGVHTKVIGDLMKQFKKQKKTMKGGRVAFPIAYFGGDAPSSAPEMSVASIDGDIRPEMPLNDPSGVLGTEKAMQPYVAEGGRRPHFVVTKKAVQSTMKHLQESQETGNTFDTSAEAQNFVNVTKQKIEDVMTDILSKASNTAKSTVSKASNTATNTVNLGAAKIADILRLKKYQTFKV